MSEEANVISVPAMLRMTGENTAEFMKQVADHIEKLEGAIRELQDRITNLESVNDNDNTAQ